MEDGNEELRKYGQLSAPTREKLLIIFGKSTTGVFDTKMPDAVLMGQVASLQHTERKRIKYQEEVVDPIYNKYIIDRQEIDDNTKMTPSEKTAALDKLVKDRDLELNTAFIKSGLPQNPLFIPDFDSKKICQAGICLRYLPRKVFLEILLII